MYSEAPILCRRRSSAHEEHGEKKCGRALEGMPRAATVNEHLARQQPRLKDLLKNTEDAGATRKKAPTHTYQHNTENNRKEKSTSLG